MSRMAPQVNGGKSHRVAKLLIHGVSNGVPLPPNDLSLQQDPSLGLKKKKKKKKKKVRKSVGKEARGGDKP